MDRVGVGACDREGFRGGQRRDDLGRVPSRARLLLHRLVSAGAGRAGASLSDAPLVLICDDESQILRALRVILRDAGYEAIPADSGEDALDAAAVRHPDAAIIDLVLPGID